MVYAIVVGFLGLSASAMLILRESIKNKSKEPKKYKEKTRTGKKYI
jgi:hypothetical protein